MPFVGMTARFSTLLLHVLLVLLCASSPCNGDGAPPTHDITAILAASPDFTDFSAALAAANLTGEIDGRHYITVLAVDNAAMSRLRDRGLRPDRLARVLSLHVLLDYFGDAKLRALNATQEASLFQASGAAAGNAGEVSIRPVSGAGDGRAGVAFAAADAGGHTVFYEKSVKESPYDIAVLQVTDAMESPSAEGKALPSPAPVVAPAPAPVGAPSSPKNQTAPPPPPPPAAAPSPTNLTAPAPPPKPSVAPSSPTNHTAPAPPPKPSVAPSSPTNQTAPPPKHAGGEPAPAPADAPVADDQPPADENGQHNDGAGDTVARWSVFAAVAAVVLLLW